MTYTPGKLYLSRAGATYMCIAGWGSLPKFIGSDGRIIVQAADGRYMFDGTEHPRDIVGEIE